MRGEPILGGMVIVALVLCLLSVAGVAGNLADTPEIMHARARNTATVDSGYYVPFDTPPATVTVLASCRICLPLVLHSVPAGTQSASRMAIELRTGTRFGKRASKRLHSSSIRDIPRPPE